MNLQLDHALALVTASTGGIGKEIATTLAPPQQTKAQTLGKQLEECVRRDPIKAILITVGVGLGVGFLVGLLVRR